MSAFALTAKTSANVDALVQWYESLSLDTVAQAERFYAADAQFIDPFNAVQGLPTICAIFTHMFSQVTLPRFTVLQRFVGDGDVMLRWRFAFQRGAQAYQFEGCSLLRFNADGLVVWHRDYWDAANELYTHFPVLGGLMRWLKRRLATPLPS